MPREDQQGSRHRPQIHPAAPSPSVGEAGQSERDFRSEAKPEDLQNKSTAFSRNWEYMSIISSLLLITVQFDIFLGLFKCAPATRSRRLDLEFIIRIYRESAAFEMKDTEKIIRQLLRIIYLWVFGFFSASGVLRVSLFVLARASSPVRHNFHLRINVTRVGSPSQTCAWAHASAVTDGV